MISMDRPEMESRPYEFLLQHKAENIHYLLAQLGPGVVQEALGCSGPVLAHRVSESPADQPGLVS